MKWSGHQVLSSAEMNGPLQTSQSISHISNISHREPTHRHLYVLSRLRHNTLVLLASISLETECFVLVSVLVVESLKSCLTLALKHLINNWQHSVKWHSSNCIWGFYCFQLSDISGYYNTITTLDAKYTDLAGISCWGPKNTPLYWSYWSWAFQKNRIWRSKIILKNVTSHLDIGSQKSWSYN